MSFSREKKYNKEILFIQVHDNVRIMAYMNELKRAQDTRKWRAAF